MTTIAFDGKTLAVDSMTSCDRFVNSRTTQKLWGRTGRFQCVALAGRTCTYPLMLKWLEDGADPLTWKEDWDGVAWVVDDHGEVYRYASGHPERIEGIDADGSGAEFAIGAMDAGASAVEALEITANRDFYTGGLINAFYIPQKHLAAVK